MKARALQCPILNYVTIMAICLLSYVSILTRTSRQVFLIHSSSSLPIFCYLNLPSSRYLLAHTISRFIQCRMISILRPVWKSPCGVSVIYGQHQDLNSSRRPPGYFTLSARRLQPPHSIEVRLHVLNTDVVILAPATVGSISVRIFHPRRSHRCCPGPHYHADVIRLLPQLGINKALKGAQGLWFSKLSLQQLGSRLTFFINFVTTVGLALLWSLLPVVLVSNKPI